MRQAMQEYLKHMDSEDALFREFLPWILNDRQESDRLSHGGIAKTMWEELGSSWHLWSKGEKVSLSRFFGFLKAAAPLDKVWHQKLLTLVYLGLQAGWLTQSRFEELAKTKRKIEVAAAAAEKAEGEGDAGRERTRQTHSEIKKLREAAKNTLHLATLFLSDPMTQSRTRVMLAVCRPCQDWHHSESHAKHNLARVFKGTRMVVPSSVRRLARAPCKDYGCLNGFRSIGVRWPRCWQEDRFASRTPSAIDRS